jgi:hypothetical protein
MSNLNIALSTSTDQEILAELKRRDRALKFSRQSLPEPSNLGRPCWSQSCNVENWDCRTKVEVAAESLRKLEYTGDKIEPKA